MSTDNYGREEYLHRRIADLLQRLSRSETEVSLVITYGKPHGSNLNHIISVMPFNNALIPLKHLKPRVVLQENLSQINRLSLNLKLRSLP